MENIIPAILPKDENDLTEKVSSLPIGASIFHLDVLNEGVWEDTGRNFEAHLMIPEPEKTAEKWVQRGAQRIIVHSFGKWSDDLRAEVEIGLGVEIEVPLEEVFKLAPRADFIQLMSIADIGEQGNELDERIFDRIKAVKEKFPETPVSVDGGIKVSNYQKLLDAGADRLVVGSGFEELFEALNK